VGPGNVIGESDKWRMDVGHAGRQGVRGRIIVSYGNLRMHGCRSWQPELFGHITVSTSTTWTAHVSESINDGPGPAKCRCRMIRR